MKRPGSLLALLATVCSAVAGTRSPGQIHPGRWSMENLPAGVSLGSVARVDDTHVNLALKGNSQAGASRSDIVDVTVIAEAGEVADSASLLIATRGAMLDCK